MSTNPLYRIPNTNHTVTVSVESFFPGTNNIINIIDTLNTSISNFTNELAKSFSDIKSQMREKAIGKLEFTGKFEYNPTLPASLRVKGYIGVKDAGVQIPPGFKGNMSDYITTMSKVMFLLEDFHEKYFPSADKYLATLLNDDRKLYSHQSFTDVDLAKNINESKTLIADFFKGSQASHLKPFGDVYRSLNEWQDSMGELNALLRRLNSYSPDMVTKEINSLSDKADRLILKLKKKGDAQITQATAKDIANVIYTMATAYEFYGAFVQFTNELFISVVNLNSTILRN